ncbi:MAG: peptidase MA family metallohydrolase [candidate division Zixibacteria bacterium]|nr:peptidase MA family metallohydrolase [candidate division Zixibacteria bacterium]MDH3938789.1 peptidase MA family metallohydrolase [candidate division Zixibacteria bacterium]MDH4032346.1 peptidase MA family metallohydrolase [candidate division Zixibacteria bacterium]
MSLRPTIFITVLLALLPNMTAATVPARPQPIEREYFTYYLDNPRFLEITDSALTYARFRLVDLLEDTLTYKPSIHIVGNLRQFNDLIRGRFPDWGAAAAFAERKLIAIKSPDKFNLGKSLDELLIHEYAHLAVSHKTGLYSAPRWLHEGIAMFASMEWSWSDNLAMNRAAVFGDFLTLSEIENMNRYNESRAHVAYAQSYLAVKYIYDNYGDNALAVLLGNLARGASLNSALMASTGATAPEFEIEFHEYLDQRFNIVMLFMDTMFLWLGLALIVIVASFVRFKKRRQYYKKWEEEEKLHSTDFDYGDPDNPEQADDDEPWRS